MADANPFAADNLAGIGGGPGSGGDGVSPGTTENPFADFVGPARTADTSAPDGQALIEALVEGQPQSQDPMDTAPVDINAMSEDDYQSWLKTASAEDIVRAHGGVDGLRSAILRRGDYSKKTAALSQERKLTGEMQRQLAEMLQPAQTVPPVAQTYVPQPVAQVPTVYPPQGYNPFGEPQVDPVVMQLAQQVQGLQQTLQQQQESLKQQRNQQALQALQGEFEQLVTENPWLGEGEVGQIMKYMQENQVFDPRVVFNTIYLDKIIEERMKAKAPAGRQQQPPPATPTGGGRGAKTLPNVRDDNAFARGMAAEIDRLR